MKTPVTVRVAYPAEADAGDRVQVYTDYGTGVIDYSKPLLARPARMFLGAKQRFAGLGSELMGQHVLGTGRDTPLRGGLGEQILGSQPLAVTERALEVRVEVPPGYGRWKFAAAIVDALGNVQSGAPPTVEEFVSGEEPPGLETFAFSAFNAGPRTVTFAFTRNGE